MARTTPVNAGYAIIGGTGTGSNGARTDVWLEYKVLSQDMLANTSTVRLVLYAAATFSSSTKYTVPALNGYVGYDGGNREWLESTYDFSNRQVNCFGDHTYTIQHADDGTRSVTLQGAFTTRSSYISGGSASGTVALPVITRATTPTVSGTVMGQETIITLAPASEDFTHSLRWTFGASYGGITGKTAERTIAYTFPETLAAEIPSADSGTLQIICDTYQGETLIGSRTVSVALSVPADMAPSGTVQITEQDAGAAALGFFVQHISKLLIQTTATGIYGSTIAAISTTIAGSTYEGAEVTAADINAAGQVQVVTTITDSRQRRKVITTPIQIEAYAYPEIGEYSVTRCSADGTENRTGAYAKVRIAGEISSLQSKNAKAYKIQYKKTSESTYASVTGTPGYTADVTEILPDIDTAAAYDFKISLQDSFGSVERTAQVPVAAVIMNVRADGAGIGFGKISEAVGYEFADKVTVHGDIHADNFPTSMADYVVEDGTTDTYWTWRKWASGVAECWYRGYRSGVSCQYQWGAIYSHGVATVVSVPYPIDFVSVPMCEVTPISTGAGSVFLTSYAPGDKTKTPEWEAVRGTAATGQALDYMIYAVGRWK